MRVAVCSCSTATIRRVRNGRTGSPSAAQSSGESLAAAAVRELWEETGIEITEQQLGLPYHRGTHAFSYDGVDLSPMKASSRCDWTTSRLASTESKATR